MNPKACVSSGINDRRDTVHGIMKDGPRPRTACTRGATLTLMMADRRSFSVHVLPSDTRWLSVLRVRALLQPPRTAAIGPPRNATPSKRRAFAHNASRHPGYENPQLHRRSTQLRVLMFEFAKPSFFSLSFLLRKSGTKV